MKLRRFIMSVIKLGKLEEVDIRKLWSHEQ